MTVKEYLEAWNKLIEENPNAEEFEIIQSSDDEGNNHQKVIYTPTLVQVHDLREYFLEIVGNQGNLNINDTDLNAVCIN